MRTLKFILLPLLGIVAAIIAFRIAAPYESTLSQPDLGSEDPRALFTYGTKWGEVNRIAFGALLCGPFAVCLALGRRSALHVLLAGITGAVLGAIVNFITDSSADIIGIFVSTRRGGVGPFIAMLSWCVLVPLGIAFTLVIAQGPTQQRIKRAVFAVKWAAAASFVVQIVGGMLVSQDAGGEISLQSQIPVWRMVEIAVGLAFGITILAADEFVRRGTIRLLHGKNEYIDWSLDYAVSRIGSAEGCEIYVRGFKRVEAVHAQIVQQGDQFVLEPQASVLVNGATAGRTVLTSGDQITLGEAQLVFTSQAAQFYIPSVPFQQAPYMSAASIRQAPYTPMSQQPIYIAPAPSSAVLQDAQGRQIPLSPGRYGMGQSPNNAFCFQNDPRVSPSHAEIIVTDAGVTVIDLNSATGTMVNGNRIVIPTTMRLGDTLDIGASRFTYVT